MVVGASLVGFAFNALSPRGVSLLKEPPPLTSSAWKEISLENARALFGQAVFVDARSKEDYAAGHIGGAVSLPLHEFDAEWANFTSTVPPELELIVYCSGGDCELSHKLAERLAQANYKSIFVLTAGYDAWKAGNLPVATGSN
jgi:rhodanese-related sulfurtransferase